MISNDWEKPLQVYIRSQLEENVFNTENKDIFSSPLFANESLVYALIVCSIIPILIIYPFIQKYFAKGTNVGGVKE
jgi:putative aldouronate transport system permease protein